MYTIYIIELSDNSFYTGIAKDLQKRLDVHRAGKGSKYVKARLPIVRVIYCENAANRSAAQKREHAIKKLTKKKKRELGQDWPPYM